MFGVPYRPNETIPNSRVDTGQVSQLCCEVRRRQTAQYILSETLGHAHATSISFMIAYFDILTGYTSMVIYLCGSYVSFFQLHKIQSDLCTNIETELESRVSDCRCY